jgi:hypothetical protein
MNFSDRDSVKDPEDNNAAIRAENERRRTMGNASWGGRDIAGKKVWIEGVVYNFIGTAVSVQFGMVWLSDGYKVLNNDDAGPESSMCKKMGYFSVPVAAIMLLGLQEELSFFDNWQAP